jgi:hypothetical protein
MQASLAFITDLADAFGTVSTMEAMKISKENIIKETCFLFLNG